MQARAFDTAPAIEVSLTLPGWTSVGATHAIGQAHAANGTFLRARDIAQYFDNIADRNAWLADIAKLNGSFAVVGHRGDELRAAVDRLRSFPLFYTGAARTRLSDRATSLIPSDRTPTLDPDSRLEFQYVGYVTGEDTLVAGLRQIRAGHVLLHDQRGTSEPRQLRYYE